MHPGENKNVSLNHTSLTTLLHRINGGDRDSFRRLVDLVYDDLQRIASRRLKNIFGRPLESLTEGPTDIASRATLKLWQQRADWKNTEQFFAVAATLIGYIVNDYKDHRFAKKRNVGCNTRNLDALAGIPTPHEKELSDAELAALEALECLTQEYPRKAEVFALRVITDHSEKQVAEKLHVSIATVQKDFKIAKGWLHDHLRSKGMTHDA
ncbi:MAG TPA: sigma-70 family RNA polymerase sigma factor [Tepidisphaeraceae bacterium]|jgi:RNA polymerase sigma factor (TIGR02999 family)